MDINLNEIIKEARENPEVLSQLDVEELLENAEDFDEEALANKTMADFAKEIYDVLYDLMGTDQESIEAIQDICLKLKDYRYIHRLCDLRVGRHIRWIDKTNGKFSRGGNLIKIEIFDEKTSALCRNYRFFSRCMLDNCIVFQKLTMEEQLFLILQKEV